MSHTRPADRGSSTSAGSHNLASVLVSVSAGSGCSGSQPCTTNTVHSSLRNSSMKPASTAFGADNREFRFHHTPCTGRMQNQCCRRLQMYPSALVGFLTKNCMSGWSMCVVSMFQSCRAFCSTYNRKSTGLCDGAVVRLE